MNLFEPQSADLFDVKIERIVPDGFGIGFAENLTFFVPLVAAGDLARVRIERKKGKVAFASLVEILEPSKDRVKPPCPYFGVCGGCDFQQMNYEAQLAAKVGILKDCLRRIGKIDFQEEIEITPSPQIWNYRTRANWKRDGEKTGYFERSSHQVRDIQECPILVKSLQETLLELRKSSEPDFVSVQSVAAREEVSLRFEQNSDAPDFDENFYAANKPEAERARATISVAREKAREIGLQIGKFRYHFSADCFFQVNHSILQSFIETALKNFKGQFALDLFCGAGLFTLPLAESFSRVIGVEGNKTSIAFARQNADRAGLLNADFEVSSVGTFLAKNIQGLSEVDFVLLDPPRTGAEKETIEILCRLRPKRICYVSCNPATLARDLRLLIDGGSYKIEEIRAFDFFPQTHHVETIVHLALND